MSDRYVTSKTQKALFCNTAARNNENKAALKSHASILDDVELAREDGNCCSSFIDEKTVSSMAKDVRSESIEKTGALEYTNFS
jgi:hypothetical protein